MRLCQFIYGAFTVTVSVTAGLPLAFAEALIVVGVLAVTVVVVIVKGTVEAPAATTTEAGTDAALLVLNRYTVVATAVGPVNATVPVADLPPIIVELTFM